MSVHEDGRRTAGRLKDGSIDLETFLGWLDDATRERLGWTALKVDPQDPVTGATVTLVRSDQWRPVASPWFPALSTQQQLQEAMGFVGVTPQPPPLTRYGKTQCVACGGSGRCPICQDVWPESGRCVDESRSEHGYDGTCSRCEGAGWV